jgi:hypothetical protein
VGSRVVIPSKPRTPWVGVNLPPTQEMPQRRLARPRSTAPDRATSRQGDSVRRMWPVDITPRCLFSAVVLCAVLAVSCGDDAGPEASPLQEQAIGTLIDAELTTDEQRCILEDLIDTDIDPQAVIDGTVTGDEDAELLAMAVSCVDDLASVPAFVQTMIEALEESGRPASEAEAICVIGKMAEGDPATAAVECIGASPADGALDTYGDDRTLDLLWDSCESGNNQSCDELYSSAPIDTGYLEYARTCGGRLPDSVGLRCFLDLG